MNNILENAIDEVMSTSMLSLPTRKKIWLSFGEVDFEAEKHPANITEGCKKRIELAKCCVKKVIPEWEKARKDDLRPKKILKLIDNYLNGKVKLSEIESITKEFEDEMQILINNNSDKIEYEVSMAATYVSYLLFHDEPLLAEDEDIECLDEDLDPDMWDASYQAYRVYKNTDEMATEEMQKTKGMEFWLWYIEQAAKINNSKDINKKIKSCKQQLKELIIECQTNKNKIDDEVSLENFIKYIDDNFKYDSYEVNKFDIRIIASSISTSANCIYCNSPSSEVSFEYKTKTEIPMLNKDNKKVYLIEKIKEFYCHNKECCEESFPEKTRLIDVVMANCKRYLSDENRKAEIQSLLGL